MLNISRGLCKMAAKQQKKPRPPSRASQSISCIRADSFLIFFFHMYSGILLIACASLGSSPPSIQNPEMPQRCNRDQDEPPNENDPPNDKKTLEQPLNHPFDLLV